MSPSRSRSRAALGRISSAARAEAASATDVLRMISSTDFTIVCGVTWCSALYASCASRLRFISSTARRMAPVIWSA